MIYGIITFSLRHCDNTYCLSFFWLFLQNGDYRLHEALPHVVEITLAKYCFCLVLLQAIIARFSCYLYFSRCSVIFSRKQILLRIALKSVLFLWKIQSR